MNEKNKAAIYLRISREDGDMGESGSISNQRQLLMSFLSEREDLEFSGEYVDDGVSGYQFNRPGFNRMMQDARDGKFNCIIVKDLSRLGRNFQKTEEYLQRIFPHLGIRFIAVNNCYDSSREITAGEQLMNPMINLINEFHVMETSQKVRSVLEYHRRNGKFIGNHAPYGYVIKDKHLEIDDDAADIVHKIFKLKIEGMSNQGIADYLNSLNVSSPLEHKLDKGIAVTGAHLKKNQKALWGSMTVRRILNNPVYIGTLIQGKTTAVSYRDRRRIKRAESELLAFENSHDAIISDTAFLIVQDLLNRDGYSSPQKVSYLFTGFIFCGCCGKPLYHRQDKDRGAWQCKNNQCACGSIHETALIDSVSTILHKHIEVIMDHSEPIDNDELLQNLHLKDMKIQELSKQIERLQASCNALDEKKDSGVITQADHMEMAEYYQQKINAAKAEIKEIELNKIRLAACVDEIVEQYRKYDDMKELTRENLVTFIERIFVFSKDNIHILFRYEDFFKKDGDIYGT